MASLSNINGLFDVHSTGAILFSTSHGTSGQILRSNGNAAPTWVAASTVIGGPYLPLTGGTLSGPLSGTSATFSGTLTVGGNNVVGFSGSWNGADMPGSRWNGYSVNGGEIVFQRDNPNSGQMSILVDGGYYAGENNGFYSLYSSNSYNSKAGFYADTSGVLQFNAPATFTGLVSGITPTAAANFATKAYVDGIDHGVTQITAGTNVTITPVGGTGNVTINANTQGDITAISVSNGITGSSLSGPIPAILMSGSYTGTFTATSLASDSFLNNAGNLLFSAGNTTTGASRSLNLRTSGSTGDPSASDDANSTGITWGQRTDSNPYYIIYPNLENWSSSGNYSKLTLAWHTGIKIGAASGYGGTRFYNNSPDIAGAAVIMNVGVGNDNIGVVNALTVGTTINAGGVVTAAGGNSTQWNSAYANQGNYLPLAGGTMTGLLQINTSVSSAGTQLKIYATGAHQYPQIYSNGAYEAMWNYKNSAAEWYVGIRTTSQLLGTSGFHFYNTTSGQTVGGWDISGNSYSIVSSRAPIFYDSNDTGYYVDPASTSNLNTVTAAQFNGPLSGNASTSTTFNTGRTNYYNVTNNAVIGQMMWKNYGNNHTIFDASQSTSPSGSSVNNTNSNTAWSSSYPTLMGWNGSSTYGVRVDSARIADSAANQGNYLPLAGGTMTGALTIKDQITLPSSGLSSASGTPAYAIYQTPGAWTYPYPDLNIAMHTGIRMAANSGYGGFRFYSDYNTLGTASAQIMSINNSSDGLGAGQVYVNDALQAGSSLRAPIFYDSNNTGYYGDFASTTAQYQAIAFGDSSRYSAINTTVNGSGNGDKLILYGNTSNYDGRVLVGTDYDVIFKSQGAPAGKGSFKFYSGTSCALALTIDASQNTISTTSSIAPIFYDTNTAYYGDFASTSNLNALTLVGTLSGQNGYFNQDLAVGFNSGAIGGKVNIQINSANGIGIKNNLNGKSGAQGLLQYTSASYASGGYNMIFQAAPPSGSDVNMLLCYLNGNIVNRFNSYGQYSDRKLKENIVDTTPKLEDVKKIRIRNFNFKDDPYKQIGVIAQEFEEVFPGLVEDKEVPDQDETVKTVKYSVLVPILVKAMQEQQVIIDDLKLRIEKLEL